MSFLAILETHNFEFGKFRIWKLLKFTENKNSETKIDKHCNFGLFELTDTWFHVKSEWR